MTFGGMWSFLDARGAMLEFGLPERIAGTPAAAAVMHINNARTTVFGLCMYTFYFRRNLAACDTILAILGAYAGLVDSYVVWREGNPRKAAFRLVSSGLLSAVGTGVNMVGTNAWAAMIFVFLPLKFKIDVGVEVRFTARAQGLEVVAHPIDWKGDRTVKAKEHHPDLGIAPEDFTFGIHDAAPLGYVPSRLMSRRALTEARAP
ncbi:hypothetical protein SLS62_004156 [Diatrype stigma]|uniref:Uncharacterized protein n=1 Tax=Diatrype stigma TaxID=117547 RepID=A0AAN9UTR6_9PEZI